MQHPPDVRKQQYCPDFTELFFGNAEAVFYRRREKTGRVIILLRDMTRKAFGHFQIHP